MRENLDDLAPLRLIYIAGRDGLNRPVVVFATTSITSAQITTETFMNRLQLYMVKVMDPVVVEPYVAVFFNDDTSSPFDFNWIRKSYAMLGRNYMANLKHLYVVHPSLWMKMMVLFSKPFASDTLLEKVIWVEFLMDLFQHVPRRELFIPDSSFRIDKQRNGLLAVTHDETL